MELGGILDERSAGCKFSEEMLAIIQAIQHDNYSIDSSMKDDSLMFGIRKGLKVIRSVVFYPSQFKFVFAKRNARLPEVDGNWYPQFRIYEICFESPESAMVAEQNLLEVLQSEDLFNEKNYDFIVRNHDRLIYVSCGAKIFAEYALNYEGMIQEIVNH